MPVVLLRNKYAGYGAEFLAGEVGEFVEPMAEAVRGDPGGVTLVDVAQPVLECRVVALLLGNRAVGPPYLGLPLYEDQPHLDRKSVV